MGRGLFLTCAFVMTASSFMHVNGLFHRRVWGTLVKIDLSMCAAEQKGGMGFCCDSLGSPL